MTENLPVVTNKTTLATLMERQKEKIGELLPKSVTPERLMRVIMNLAGKQPKIFQCSQVSVLGCVMKAAEINLEPDTPNQFAHIIPFGKEAQFIIGYRGFIELAYRSGEISSITARVVYENEEFECEYGLNEKLVHKPILDSRERGKRQCAYAVAHYKGEHRAPIFVVLSKDDIQKRRAVSPAAKQEGSIWDKWTDEMWRKSTIRALASLLPKTPELQHGISIDDDSGFTADDLDLTKEVKQGGLEGRKADTTKAKTTEPETKPEMTTPPADHDQDKPLPEDVRPMRERRTADEIQADAEMLKKFLDIGITDNYYAVLRRFKIGNREIIPRDKRVVVHQALRNELEKYEPPAPPDPSEVEPPTEPEQTMPSPVEPSPEDKTKREEFLSEFDMMQRTIGKAAIGERMIELFEERIDINDLSLRDLGTLVEDLRPTYRMIINEQKREQESKDEGQLI